MKFVCDGQPKTVSAGQFVVIMILLQKIFAKNSTVVRSTQLC